MTLLTRCIFVVVATISFLASAGAATEPKLLVPHSAAYKIKVSVLGGDLQTKLELTDDGYVATHAVRPSGMARMFGRGVIRESSEFRVTSNGIRATSYSSKDTLSSEPENIAIRFDWEAGEASGTVNNKAFESALEGLSHDRISIQYQLMYDLLNGAENADYTIFEVDRLRAVSVRNIGTQTVKVPAGEYAVVGIQHQAEGSKRVTTLWCAEELGYLPVVIEQHREGALKFRATLAKYQNAADVTSVR